VFLGYPYRESKRLPSPQDTVCVPYAVGQKEEATTVGGNRIPEAQKLPKRFYCALRCVL
jgi:hypothetical protein